MFWSWSSNAIGSEWNDQPGRVRSRLASCRSRQTTVCPWLRYVVFGEVPNPLGRSFSVNSRLRGETIGRRLLRDETWATARTRLVRESAQALAAIHQIPQAELAPTAIPSEPDPLGALFETYVATGDAHPTLDLAFRWLDLNRPPPEPLCLVHGDFRLGNLLFAPTGLAAALDWESTHIGHPGEDLGWLCVRAWRFGGAHPVAGRWVLRPTARRVRGRGRHRHDQAVTALVGSVRNAPLGGRVPRARRRLPSRADPVARDGGYRKACCGERVRPVEAAEMTELPRRRNQPFDAPDAAALISAVREYLHDDLLPRTSGPDRWILRVAANALAIAEREIDMAPEIRRAHESRLRALGVADDVALSERIRGGDFDHRIDELVSHLSESVSDSLSVANPGYVGRARTLCDQEPRSSAVLGP